VTLMTGRFLRLLLIAATCLVSARSISAQQSVTLYSPRNKEMKSYDDSRALFSFIYAVRGREAKERTGGVWDLGYGNLLISDEDWFEVGLDNDERTVIKDLGKLSWSDSFSVPVLTPLPELAPGQKRTIGVDASGDTHKQWAATNGVFAKAIAGHIYAVHIKRVGADLYFLFRVDHLEQQDNCVISWKQIPAPER
jgi:hypothetical protein